MSKENYFLSLCLCAFFTPVKRMLNTARVLIYQDIEEREVGQTCFRAQDCKRSVEKRASKCKKVFSLEERDWFELR
jgi:hypothetical protein